MRKQEDLFRLDVISGIDDEIIDRHLKKRFALWFKRKKRRVRYLPLIAAILSVALLMGGALALFPLLVPQSDIPDDDGTIPDNGILPDGRQIPIYLGMTVSTEAPAQGQLELPTPTDASALVPLAELIPLDEEDGKDKDKDKDKDGNSSDTDNGSGNDNKDNNGNKDEPIIFGETYYAKKHEDIYIHIHFSNPDEFEILSFTLNGVKYSTYMFEQGSDLETLILKYNVGDANGLQEYTIDAIKYVDGEKIKDVRMQGDQTVKVYVSSDNHALKLNAYFRAVTMYLEPSWDPDFKGVREILSLAVYEGEEKIRELDPDTTEITDLPGNKRLILKATFDNNGQIEEVSCVFDAPKLSEGLAIQNGYISGIGNCTDTILYLDAPIEYKAFSANNQIVEVHMTENVTEIGRYAFEDCNELVKVVLPEGLTSIGLCAFIRCRQLSDVTLPESLEIIEGNVFRGCYKLKTIRIPANVTSIGEVAFDKCGALTTIYFEGDVLPNMSSTSFANCPSLTDIYFAGGMESWSKSLYSGYFTNVTVHCSDGKVYQ